MEMNYKRLEIYVGWTCNQKCTYCIEFQNMEMVWNKRITKYDILKKLIKYKKLGYNHVTLLGGEPFIQPVFFDALKIAKRLKYTTLVTTNCTTLHINNQASKILPYIDELFLSIQAIAINEQQKISRSRNFVQWDEVFYNIDKYWRGNLLKASIVITQDNKNNLFELVKFLSVKGINNIAITYPDVLEGYYLKQHILDRITPKYTEIIVVIILIVKYCDMNNINLKLVDFPFCVFPRNDIDKYVSLTDDYDYCVRLKVTHEEVELIREKLNEQEQVPRNRFLVDKCEKCFYNKICWGPSIYYKNLYGLDEIIPLIK